MYAVQVGTAYHRNFYDIRKPGYDPENEDISGKTYHQIELSVIHQKIPLGHPAQLLNRDPVSLSRYKEYPGYDQTQENRDTAEEQKRTMHLSEKSRNMRFKFDIKYRKSSFRVGTYPVYHLFNR